MRSCIKAIAKNMWANWKRSGRRCTSNWTTFPIGILSRSTKRFRYFAQEFDLHIAAIINREPESEPSARELADTILLVRSSGVKALFVEPQYPKTAADIISNETQADVYVLDPGVSGEESKDAYLNIMEQNLQVLLTALQ